MNVFMDMDGVLAVYEKSAYIATPGTTPLYLDTEKHYYRDAIPDDRMVAVACKLKATPMAFITKVSADPTCAAVQLDDKRAWVQARNIFHDNGAQTYVPHIIGCMCTADCPTKADWMTNVLGRTILPTDILIDDYNDELHAWTRAGGTAIKYANGYSNKSDSWNGLTIMPDTSADDIHRMLMNINDGICACSNLVINENYLNQVKASAYVKSFIGGLDADIIAATSNNK